MFKEILLSIWIWRTIMITEASVSWFLLPNIAGPGSAYGPPNFHAFPTGNGNGNGNGHVNGNGNGNGHGNDNGENGYTVSPPGIINGANGNEAIGNGGNANGINGNGVDGGNDFGGKYPDSDQLPGTSYLPLGNGGRPDTSYGPPSNGNGNEKGTGKENGRPGTTYLPPGNGNRNGNGNGLGHGNGNGKLSTTHPSNGNGNGFGNGKKRPTTTYRPHGNGYHNGKLGTFYIPVENGSGNGKVNGNGNGNNVHGNGNGVQSITYGPPVKGNSMTNGNGKNGIEIGLPGTTYLPSGNGNSDNEGNGDRGGEENDDGNNTYLPPVNGGNRGYSSSGPSGYAGGEEISAPVKYEIDFEVKDPENGNEFGHKEQRDGDLALGEYHILLPDGKKQIIQYEADTKGYKPVISFEDANGNAGFSNNGNVGYPTSGNGGYPPTENGVYPTNVGEKGNGGNCNSGTGNGSGANSDGNGGKGGGMNGDGHGDGNCAGNGDGKVNEKGDGGYPGSDSSGGYRY